jgi:hypothetical protein
MKRYKSYKFGYLYHLSYRCCIQDVVSSAKFVVDEHWGFLELVFYGKHGVELKYVKWPHGMSKYKFCGFNLIYFISSINPDIDGSDCRVYYKYELTLLQILQLKVWALYETI